MTAVQGSDGAASPEEYAVAIKIRDDFWISKEPRATLYLQNALRVAPAQVNCFVMGVELRGEGVERYLVPDRRDGLVWSFPNGLDGVEWLHESLQLFDTVEDAKKARIPASWQRLTIYRFVEDSARRVLFLEAVLHNERESS